MHDINVDLTGRATDVAVQHRRPTPGLLLHHDRGRQYTAARYVAKAEAAKIQLSVGRSGMPDDNAMAESSLGRLKPELTDDKPFNDREAARCAVFEYVEPFYTRVRMHSALDHRSPVQAERGPNGQVYIRTTCPWKAGQSDPTPFLPGTLPRFPTAPAARARWKISVAS